MTDQRSHVDRLTTANRHLLDEMHHLKRRLAAAERCAALLDTVAGDWSEAQQALFQWRRGPTSPAIGGAEG